MSEGAATEKGERIAKRLARAGLCSRRDAERWIGEGRVKVDGQVLATPAVIVTAASRIEVDGKPVGAAEPTRLWRYHKPRGLVTTHRDPQGRATIFASLSKRLPRVISVGRLDLNSEGLILLTNDGELARHLELPSTGWVRRYRVRAHGAVDPKRLAALEKGITIAGISYGPVEAALERQQGTNAWLIVALREGKNREVRRILEHLGLQVTRLIRMSYGPFQLGSLEPGAVEEVPGKVMKEQLGQEFIARSDPADALRRTPVRVPSGAPGLPPQAGEEKDSLPRAAGEGGVGVRTPRGDRRRKTHAHRRRPA